MRTQLSDLRAASGSGSGSDGPRLTLQPDYVSKTIARRCQVEEALLPSWVGRCCFESSLEPRLRELFRMVPALWTFAHS
ncbi:hypothetical protein U0070_008915 [Myodes glareolus]|uniref:Uncharacterized protein n=1 Tax=Myodes glareolus TaxID=447135 RepID=A0AAW0H5C0_MYOGA